MHQAVKSNVEKIYRDGIICKNGLIGSNEDCSWAGKVDVIDFYLNYWIPAMHPGILSVPPRIKLLLYCGSTKYYKTVKEYVDTVNKEAFAC